MSGILDSKSRIIDAIITSEGRRQLAERTFKVAYVTFTDADGDAIDLSSGYDWKMDVKDTDTSSSDIISDDSFAYSGNSSGQLTITASATTMAAVVSGSYVYDLQSSVAGVVKTWLYGIFKINEDISE